MILYVSFTYCSAQGKKRNEDEDEHFTKSKRNEEQYEAIDKHYIELNTGHKALGY